MIDSANEENKWVAPILVGGILIVGGIVYYLTRPKESTYPSYPTSYPIAYVSLTKAEPQPSIRQSPMPCEAICPGCNKIIHGNIKEDYCLIPPHEDCWYKGSDTKILA